MVDSLISIKELDKDLVLHSNSNLLNFDKKRLRINSMKLFDSLRFTFEVNATIQTFHTNSVSSIVALTDDIVATSSYDRSIKVWRVSDGSLLKVLNDTNSVCSMVVFKYSNDKNLENDAYAEEDFKIFNRELMERPFNNISDFGLLLVTGRIEYFGVFEFFLINRRIW